MPNTPAAIGSSASVLCGGSRVRSEDLELGKQLLGAVGTCHLAPETNFDAVTALSGSGPAYVS
jgi:pyrroline-5-carboxylate reductase